jgi:hypothetical protein
MPPVNKHFYSNHLHFCFFTGLLEAIAPKLCVDFCECSVNLAHVDGRKGWHNNTEPIQIDWVIRQTGRPGGRPDPKKPTALRGAAGVKEPRKRRSHQGL